MKFSSVLSVVAVAGSVAAAPIAEANAEATFGLFGGLGGIVGGLFGGRWGGSWGGSSSWYYRKVTVIHDSYQNKHYYSFPYNYSPCGCDDDGYYQIDENQANELQGAGFQIQTDDSVTAPESAAKLAPDSAAAALEAVGGVGALASAAAIIPTAA